MPLLGAFLHGRGRTLHKRPPQSLQISLWISALWRFVALLTSAFRKRNPKRSAILPYQLPAPTKEQMAKAICSFVGAGNRGRTCTNKHKILNLARLPIPPYPPMGAAFLLSKKRSHRASLFRHQAQKGISYYSTALRLLQVFFWKRASGGTPKKSEIFLFCSSVPS